MKEKYLDDLREIREMMNRSSRFISLSGLSGISAGITALVGAYLAHHTLQSYQHELGHHPTDLPVEVLFRLLIIALFTLVIALATGIWFTTRETQKRNLKIWDAQTKRLLINLFIPLTTGGILCLMLFLKGFAGMAAPLTLVFYGLSLVNASKYTLDEIRSLGLLEIALGLLAFYFIGYGLIFWAIGFGILHIAYGLYMHLKYKS
ncbi:MAG: hypothetical protein JJU28_22470 [Cyclobacteriaceae bacterium]|nr:hypothetical protein [Cyclobacteriaceae bacterium]